MLDRQNTPPRSATPNVFQIVGIGASAGGLEAAGKRLGRLPPDLGRGDMLARHLDPKHPGILAGSPANPTRQPVREAEGGMRVAPVHVYVIPSITNFPILQGLDTVDRAVPTGERVEQG